MGVGDDRVKGLFRTKRPGPRSDAIFPQGQHKDVPDCESRAVAREATSAGSGVYPENRSLMLQVVYQHGQEVKSFAGRESLCLHPTRRRLRI